MCIQISNDILEQVKTALLDSHAYEIEFHKKRLVSLNAQKQRLEKRLHEIYIDKLDENISQDEYNRMSENWRAELEKINNSISKHENADSKYLESGVQILELCKRAYPLYLKQTAQERAKLLKYVLSNCTLDDVTLTPTYRKPFHLLAEGLHRVLPER